VSGRLLKANPPPDTSIDYSSAIGEFMIGLSPIQGWVPPSKGDDDDDWAHGIRPHVDRLFDTIQSQLPGATLAAIELALENAIEEFCYRSTYFRERVFWQMAPGVRLLTIDPYDRNLETIYITAQEGLLDYRVAPPATLVDEQIPLAARTGWALIILKPRSFAAVKRGAVAALFTNWWEVMLDGVMGRLYGQPAKPWSSPQLAQYHGTRFRQGISRARDQAERGNSAQQSRFRNFPYFARGRRKN
jgi:hypothetical protein